jgi:hypothetical protein
VAGWVVGAGGGGGWGGGWWVGGVAEWARGEEEESEYILQFGEGREDRSKT